MPKKQKKILTRKSKTKNKNTVNVKINIDNSRKTTARRTPIKPSNMQPFVNFPTFQPARIQQLEPLKKYNNGDLTKVDDLYQQQFKTYFETSDKNIKDMIAKFDDTLKKNIAPQKTEESKPGASIDYTTNEGVTVLSEPIEVKNTQIKVSEPIAESKKLPIVDFGEWGRSRELQGNNLTRVRADPFTTNKLVDKPPEAKVIEAFNEKEAKQKFIDAIRSELPSGFVSNGDTSEAFMEKMKKAKAEKARKEREMKLEHERREKIYREVLAQRDQQSSFHRDFHTWRY